jgi:hypothetical protein
MPRVDDRRFDLNTIGDAPRFIKERSSRGKVVIDIA